MEFGDHLLVYSSTLAQHGGGANRSIGGAGGNGTICDGGANVGPRTMSLASVS